MDEFGMLAHHWNETFEQVSGWFASRKYNGHSALWDGGITTGMLADEVPWYFKGGDKRAYYSTGLWSLGRKGGVDRKIKPKPIQAPKYFTDKLPRYVPVHGELWYEDRLETIKRVCGMRLGYNPMWYNIKFMAYGIKPYSLWEGIEKIPRYNSRGIIVNNFTLTGLPFVNSMGYLQDFSNETFNPVNLWLISHPVTIELLQNLAEDEGWEGLMFHNPKGMYECKRSWNNLKWKQEYETEAAIHGYEDGKTGRLIGKVGALKASLVWDEKVESVFGGNASMIGQEAVFKISGLTDKERENVEKLYPVGSSVKFTYFGVSGHGIPQSCNIWRK